MNDIIKLNYIEADLQITDIGYIYHKKRPKGFSYSSFDRDYYSLAFVISGEAEFDFGYKKEIAQKGDILFLRENESYTTTVISNDVWEHVVISFKIQNSDAADFPFNTVNECIHQKRFEELFLQAHTVFDECLSAYRIKTRAIIYEIIYQLTHECMSIKWGSEEVYSVLKTAVDFMETNYKDKITVEQLANFSGYSVSHFTRLFVKLYSVPPMQYLNHIRITHAKNLLKSKQHTVGEVAEMCGFLNVYYFSRCFKQITGITPKNY